jgi:hypothetical protein
MPQQATDHPPLRLSELPLDQQILVRLDEIIGLLDRLVTVIDVDPLPHAVERLDFLDGLWDEEEEPEP